jgi:formate--tetrahydrofolate ligase
MDVNDRAVREIEVTINAKKNIKYKTGFDITAASELMAIFCLSNSIDEMKERINNIIVAFNNNGKPIYVRDFNIINAIMKILQMAIYPNCVQSLEGNLALVHGGPFANIAHGCNSVFATKTAMNLAEYTVTEAGFGSDLGAEKFLDIVCDNAGIRPNVVVLVASIRSLKMHGGSDVKNLTKEDLTSLRNGFDNLQQHIKNIKAFGLPVVVALNQFASDTNNEIEEVGNFLATQNVPYSFTTLFAKGSKGAQQLAKKVIQLSSNSSKIKQVYNKNDNLKTKIENIVKRCYGAQGIVLSEEAKLKLSQLQNTKAYVCIAKTPLTFSDDPKQIMIKEPFSIHINDLLIANGANFIIVMAGDIFRMPGLPKEPAACKM